MILILLAVFVSATSMAADSDKIREHQIKAAFVYNFLKFVDWSEEKAADSNEPITIGIIGSNDFTKALKPLEHKKIKNRNISIKYFAGYEKLKRPQEADDRQWNEKMEVLKTCHMLLLCSRGDMRIENPCEIIKALEGSPVLTVGETDGFLESGGIVNFVIDDQKVRFEINNAAAKQAKLKIRSKLLRLAKRVIEEDGSKGAKD